MAAGTDNGRVTLARVIAELESQDRRADERHADLKSEFGEVKVFNINIEKRVRANEIEAARNQEQHKRMIWGQGAYTTIAAAITSAFAIIKG